MRQFPYYVQFVCGYQGQLDYATSRHDDVAIIHKPAQMNDRQELSILFGSSAHPGHLPGILTAYRIPLVFWDDTDGLADPATSNLSMQAVQRVFAYSKSACQEIVAEFGVPHEEVEVVPLGVEAQVSLAAKSMTKTFIGD